MDWDILTLILSTGTCIYLHTVNHQNALRFGFRSNSNYEKYEPITCVVQFKAKRLVHKFEFYDFSGHLRIFFCLALCSVDDILTTN